MTEIRKVSVIGIGSTAFTKLEGKSLKDLAIESCSQAISDANIDRKSIGAFFVGNANSGILTGQETISPLISQNIGLIGIPSAKLEGACASASIAFWVGFHMVAGGFCDYVLVAGVEKMSHATTDKFQEALASAFDIETEAKLGLTFPGFFALCATRYMHEYGLTREQMAMVSIKNRGNGVKNPRARFRKKVTLDEVVSSRLIADPLRLYDCCPISDGSAAAVICSADVAKKHVDDPVDVIASTHATGVTLVSEMESLTKFDATTLAARKAYEMARVEPKHIDFVELHDCHTITEIINTEDLGFFEKGAAAKSLEEGLTEISGKIPVNPSGGLLSKGHPVGATGCGQIYEAVLQLRGEAPNQVPDAEIGMTHNLGATGAHATAHILQRR